MTEKIYIYHFKFAVAELLTEVVDLLGALLADHLKLCELAYCALVELLKDLIIWLRNIVRL